MDIEYLLLLQNLRNSLPEWVSSFASLITKISVSFIPLCIVALIYWVKDRKAGKRIYLGFGLGLLINGLLKLIFCVYRPWIRDSRVEPYGDSKVAATGYSFPSGHSTWATTLFGGTGFWLRNKKRVLSILFYIFTIMILFSRNYLGVHTPQDVLVGCLSSILMMYVAYKIEDWTDKDPSRDKTVIIAGLLTCVALVTFYSLKSYPLDYLADGSLLVDPKKMMADSFEGIGIISSYVIFRYIERRSFDFEKMDSKKRLIVGLIACIPLIFWQQYAVSIFEALVNRYFAKFIYFFGLSLYIFVIVPWIMKIANKEK